ncbi:MAG: Crp/Fnr family transcriptional regulator [Saprospiraceae bacterium]
MKVEVLKDLFPELSKDLSFLEEIKKHGEIKKMKKGEVIIEYGDYIQFVPLMISGLLKIMRESEEGDEMLLYFLGSGQSCAASFSCCMVRKRSEIKAICEDETVILKIPLEKADQWMGKFPVWRNFVLEMYDRRMFSLIDTIDRVAFAKLDEKLLYYLQEYSIHSQGKIIHISHQEIANDLNASRESISRLLKKLESQNIVALGRNEIKVLTL